MGGTGRASEADVDDAIRWVRLRYASKILRRRTYLESLLRASSRPHKLVPTRGANGRFEIKGGAYAVHLASRLPDLRDIRMPRMIRWHNTPWWSFAVYACSVFLEGSGRLRQTLPRKPIALGKATAERLAASHGVRGC